MDSSLTVSSDAASSSTAATSDSDPITPTVVQVGGQAVSLQSVIHSGATVIQTSGGHTLQAISVSQVPSDGDATDEDAETGRKRRELLARRPSYRKILSELSGSSEAQQQQQQALVIKLEQEESNGSQTSGGGGPGGEDSAGDSPTALPGVTVVPAGALQLASPADGLQTLTMTNDSVKAASSAAQAATIVQYAQGPDGQFFIPGNVQYQITSNSLPQGVVMATSGSSLGTSSNVPEEASRKRELRLLKNREAARECRRKKKEYVKCLENRVAVLENQNKTLIEELKSLKELYCQKEAQS